MSFNNNEKFEVRVRNRKLGQIKYQLNAKVNIPLTKIKIAREEGIVKINGEEVAVVPIDGDIQYKGRAQEVKEEVEKYIKTWLAKRYIQD